MIRQITTLTWFPFILFHSQIRKQSISTESSFCNSNCCSMLWSYIIGMDASFEYIYSGAKHFSMIFSWTRSYSSLFSCQYWWKWKSLAHWHIWISVGVKEYQIVCLTCFNFSKSLSFSSLFWLSTASLKHLKIKWMNEWVSAKVSHTHFSCLTSPYKTRVWEFSEM